MADKIKRNKWRDREKMHVGSIERGRERKM